MKKLAIPKVNRNVLLLGGALLLAGIAVVLTQKMLQNRMDQIDAKARSAHQMVRVVVADRDLERGEPVSADAFAVNEVPVEYVHAQAIRPENFDQFLGARLAGPIKRGETLLEIQLDAASSVFSSTLENGNRALTTEVDEINSISGMLRPTDRIDLMVTARGTGTGAKETTFTLLANVQVLATGQTTRKREDTGQDQTYSTITLAVSPVDAQRIVVAKSSGRLTAVLRNPDDKNQNASAAMSIDDLMPKKDKAPAKQAVQYIVGDRT